MFATTCANKRRRNLPVDRRIGHFSATSSAAMADIHPLARNRHPAQADEFGLFCRREPPCFSRGSWTFSPAKQPAPSTAFRRGPSSGAAPGARCGGWRSHSGISGLCRGTTFNRAITASTPGLRDGSVLIWILACTFLSVGFVAVLA